MRKVRFILEKFQLHYIFTLIFLLSSCNVDDAIIIEENQSSVQSKEYSGEDLFRSVFYGYGEAVKDIPYFAELNSKVVSMTDEQREEYIDLQNRSIGYLKNVHPNYFTSFKQDILSKDPALNLRNNQQNNK